MMFRRRTLAALALLLLCGGCGEHGLHFGFPPQDPSQPAPRTYNVTYLWSGFAEFEMNGQTTTVTDQGEIVAATSPLFFNNTLTQVSGDADLKFRYGVVQAKIDQGWSLKRSDVAAQAKRPLPWEHT